MYVSTGGGEGDQWGGQFWDNWGDLTVERREPVDVIQTTKALT